LEGQLKLQLAALADYRAVVAKHPNAHAYAAIAGMEAAIGELRSKIDAQKSPEARLQAAMSRQAAAQKDYRATEAEVQKLAKQLQDAMDLKDAQEAKLATLSAEVAELKLSTLPAPSPLNLDALLGQLAQRGVVVSPEVWASCVNAVQPAASPGPQAPPAALVVAAKPAARTAPAQQEAPAGHSVQEAGTAPPLQPAPLGGGDGTAVDDPMAAAEDDTRGRKREAEIPVRAAARRSKAPVTPAEASVRDLLLRAASAAQATPPDPVRTRNLDRLQQLAATAGGK
jgi:hypothetical protein